MADPLLDRLPTVPQQVADGAERRRPRDGACGVEDEKSAPRQRARAGQHRADDSETGDESRDEDGLRAVPRKEPVELVQPRGCQAKDAAMPFEHPAAAAAAYEETDVVANDSAGNRDEHD